MREKKNEERLNKKSKENELEIKQANIRAWDNWGRTWLLGRAQAHSPQVNWFMKIRELIYRRVYLDMTSVIGNLEEKTVLDIGCGTSEYQKWLAQDCAQLCGLDISLEMLRLCRHDRGKSLALISADAHNLPFKNGAFNVTTTFQALHHFPNWKKALKEMIRISQQISIYEPNGDSIFHRFMHMIRLFFRIEQRFKNTDEDYRLVEYHASGFSPSMITNVLMKNNMNTKSFMSGILPETLIKKASRRFRRLLYILFKAEDFIRRIPIIRNQLGGMLIIGSHVHERR